MMFSYVEGKDQEINHSLQMKLNHDQMPGIKETFKTALYRMCKPNAAQAIHLDPVPAF